ncbi:hypothetical protein ASD78_01210 [Lysobacter sp. Root667]|uniref:sigma factor-like helix-turn-helix DNA-binding protein n=1 Tax=Lysobacter sp. Root667 TaxID=1736581 RepID=UPI0006FAE8A1|nr:sigma factor-like helix-turn-helix DNA-binding protein [Lysobacter sp. Root667]KRA81921.1 hypothetical protein ASD78_01210 [Lysobacter sp. Root667]
MSPAAAGSALSGTSAHKNDAPAALSAFLRGVERRGAVLAELQAGDAAAGDAALAAAMQAFRAGIEAAPMAEWPRRFWAQLLAQPGLHQRTRVALPLDATDRLGELGHGPRAALLLRLAAGLSEPEAAAVLGIAEPTYRLALQRALPHHDDGRADPAAWQQLREQIHRRIKTLPPERLARLTLARESALSGVASATAVERDTASAASGRRPRWLLPLLWTLLALCVLAFAATWWWPFGGVADWLGSERVRVEALPPAAAPAARYGHEAGLIGDRDFAQLADPDGDAAARELEFHNWLVAYERAGPAGLPGAALDAAEPGAESVPDPATAPAGAQAPSQSETESADAPG